MAPCPPKYAPTGITTEQYRNQGGLQPPPLGLKSMQNILFSALIETDFCTENENTPPLTLAMRISQGPDVVLIRKPFFVFVWRTPKF